MSEKDVAIRFDDLRTLNDLLIAIWDELDEAEAQASRLEAAIADPFGKNDLREAAEAFEDGWNNKRDELKGRVQEVQEQVKALLDGWEEKDRQLASGGTEDRG
ncbi:MAG: flagellar protein FlgN [Nocardioides sp.]|nr:flagellar protein FlgN [Nocardioides sp.]